MQTKKLKLLSTWKNNPFEEFSISEIMKISKKKTKTWVFNSLKELVKSKLLILKRKGNINLYSLNLDNPLLMQILQYLEALGLLNFSKLDIIIESINNIPKKNYCLLVFGSYAEGKQTRNSDLDICFLVESKLIEKKIRPHFNEIKLNYPISIHEHYVTFNEFVKMLLTKEENLGKQIFRKHKLFFNSDIYYQLIKEAYGKGFRL